ncbi:MAG: NfeD family protein [Culicoidibacterales bacterium]
MAVEWIVGLVLVGIILAVIEVFIPGIGAFAILSLISFSAAIIVMIMGAESMSVVIVGIVLLITLITTGIFLLRKAKTVYLETDVQGKVAESLEHLLHQEGIAYSVLRPGGTIEIAGELYDAIAIGTIIEKGEKIKVIRVDYRKIFVRSVKDLEKKEVE